MKKYLILLLIFALALTFTGCTGKDEVAISDEDGNKMFYSEEDLDITSTQGKEGFFILNSDETFSPLINAFYNYKGEDEETSPDRYLWLTENSYEILKLIPTLTKGSKLVMVYNNDHDIPDEFTIEKYSYKGATVGCHIYKAEDNTMYIETEDMLPGTYAAASLESVDDESEYQVLEVNDSKVLPLENIDNNMELLLGLEIGKYYKFGFYKGTKYITFNTIADTEVFQSEEVTVLNNPYTRTQNGYFEINLPSNLKAGYYYVCGIGMFKYEV